MQPESSRPKETTLRTPLYTLGNSTLDAHIAQTATKLSAEADHASFAVLQSQNLPGADVALQAIGTSLNALDALILEAQKVKSELSQRRTAVTRVVHSYHNATLPIMRLLPDVILLVVEVLARLWPPGEGYRPQENLGWITMTHVCAAWRRAALSLPSLWANIVGVFASPESFHEMIIRARAAPLTIGNQWMQNECELPEHYWCMLSQSHTLRGIDIWLNLPEVARLEESLRLRPNNDLELLSVATFHDMDMPPTHDIFPAAISLPNLRWLFLQDAYVPFEAPNLLTLSLAVEADGIVDISYTGFLDVLEQCQGLVTLELSNWIPTDPLPRHRTVRLSCLQTFVVIALETGVQYINLCQCLDLPALRYVALEDHSEYPLLALSSVFSWLLSKNQMPPCIENISEISIDADRQGPYPGLDTVIFHEDVTVCLDDGSLKSTVARSVSPFCGVGHTGPEIRRGVRIQLQKQVERGQDGLLSKTLLDGIVAGSLKLYGHSRGLAGIQTVHLSCHNHDVDWHAILQHPVDTKTLYVSYLDFPRLLPALSQTDANGATVLPRLEVIVCKHADTLAGRLWGTSVGERDDGEHTKAADSIRDMLGARAKHGVPVTRMEARCQNITSGYSNKEKLDVFLAGLVLLYV